MATATATAERITLSTADGETREARAYPDGSYACPFCSAAVLSAESWADNERNNARCYEANGEAYAVQPYPRPMRLVWEMRGCPNPACITLLNPDLLAARRAQIAEREAETARRERMHARAMERIAEDKAARYAACDAARERCQRDGTCYRCWSHSTYGGTSATRERWIRHREPANCPHVRRYATA